MIAVEAVIDALKKMSKTVTTPEEIAQVKIIVSPFLKVITATKRHTQYYIGLV